MNSLDKIRKSMLDIFKVNRQEKTPAPKIQI